MDDTPACRDLATESSVTVASPKRTWGIRSSLSEMGRGIADTLTINGYQTRVDVVGCDRISRPACRSVSGETAAITAELRLVSHHSEALGRT